MAGPAFIVVPIAGKGQGCVASRSFEVGDRVFAEAPILEQGPASNSEAYWDEVAGRLDGAVALLSASDRALFLDLSQNEAFGATKTAAGVYMTNSIPCHHYSFEHRAIFPTISRMNHACDNNAVYKWNGAIHAL